MQELHVGLSEMSWPFVQAIRRRVPAQRLRREQGRRRRDDAGVRSQRLAVRFACRAGAEACRHNPGGFGNAPREPQALDVRVSDGRHAPRAAGHRPTRPVAAGLWSLSQNSRKVGTSIAVPQEKSNHSFVDSARSNQRLRVLRQPLCACPARAACRRSVVVNHNAGC